jgi:hypothetical protein
MLKVEQLSHDHTATRRRMGGWVERQKEPGFLEVTVSPTQTFILGGK